MKTIYESFEEMGDDMTNGEYLAHQLSGHSTEICEIWQTSIKEFARALDLAGVPLPHDEKIYEKFWENMSQALVTWKAGLNRREPYSEKLGEITQEEAKARYNYEGKKGSKLVIPQMKWGNLSEDYYLIV